MPKVAPLVFVSSTKEDLSDYRDAVLRSFPLFDVLYRGMEFFGARPEPPQQVMLKELIECDLYLGIIANRYGSENSHGVSYTEVEYKMAVRRKIPRLMFIIDSKHRVVPATVDTDSKKVGKLQAFKNEIRKTSVVDSFTTPEDLVSKVTLALGKWLEGSKEEWKKWKYRKLDSRESLYIRNLYSANQNLIRDAIRQLRRPTCRAAMEHFYGVLHDVNTREAIGEEILDGLVLFADDERVSDILSQIANDLPRWRVRALAAMRLRAKSESSRICDCEIECAIGFLSSGDWHVRREAVHALGHMGVKRREKASELRGLIEPLLNDKVNVVALQTKDAISLLRGTNK